LQPTDIFLVARREKHHFVASLPPIPTICRLRHRAYFFTPHRFCAPAAPIGKPLRHLSSCGGRETAHRSTLRTAHSPAAHENGEPRRKNRGLSPKNGGVPFETPPFLPAGPRTRGANAHKKKDCTPIHLYSPLYF